jgi:hypothetical protein
MIIPVMTCALRQKKPGFFEKLRVAAKDFGKTRFLGHQLRAPTIYNIGFDRDFCFDRSQFP